MTSTTHRSHNFKDITGQPFGKLTVIKFSHVSKTGTAHWLCQCKCGNEYTVQGTYLRNGRFKSCGCTHSSHRHTHSRTYRSWVSMIQRCANPNRDNYGGRGITVCERWLAFENFLADMGERPKGKTLDRFPNGDGNYEPGNCRWATNSEQSRNRRNNRHLTAFGETKLVCEWAADPRCVVGYQTLRSRLHYGWSDEDAITKPPIW